MYLFMLIIVCLPLLSFGNVFVFLYRFKMDCSRLNIFLRSTYISSFDKRQANFMFLTIHIII
jgi:hypothetical protein